MDDILEHCSHLPEVHLAPGDTLLAEGAPPGRLYFLISGTVRVSKAGVDIARIDHPGAAFGEMSALLDRPTSASVTAVTDVRAYRCDDPGTLISQNAEVSRYLAWLLAARLHAATTYIADLKTQFAGDTSHMGMVDKVLDALLEGHPSNRNLADSTRSDPRL